MFHKHWTAVVMSCVQQGTQQIAATMEELSSGTELQANSASNLANEMNTLNEYTN